MWEITIVRTVDLEEATALENEEWTLFVSSH